MAVLVDLYYDLTCQDLAPEFEDRHETFSEEGTGYFIQLMASLHPDEPTLSLPSRICTGVIEVTESDVRRTVSRNARALTLRRCFVKAVWELLSGSKQLGLAYDQAGTFVSFHTHLLTTQAQLVSQSLRFISTAIRSGACRDIIEAHNTIRGLIAGVVSSNLALRTRDVEAFEDTPLEYVRAELQVRLPRHGKLPPASSITRGRWPDSESAMTGVPLDKGTWKNKDAAVYLFEAVATCSGTLAQCMTAMNLNVNIVQFSDNIFGDLQAAAGGAVHPALQVDAIRYLYTFRYQFTKEHLVSVLPLLLNRLGSQEVVVYTRAAVALDCILSMRAGGSTTLTLSSADVQPFVSRPLNVLLAKIGGVQRIPSVARVIITAKQALVGEHVTASPFCGGSSTSSRKAAPNPSNPSFDQYIFESIFAHIRFNRAAVPDSIAVFDSALFSSPHGNFAKRYRSCVVFQATAEVRLSQNTYPMSSKSSAVELESPTIIRLQLLGTSLGCTMPSTDMIITLLPRMQQNKRNNYIYYFAYFLLYLLAINVNGLTPDYLIQTVDEIQSGLWSQITSNFIIPQISQLVLKGDRKVAAVGLTRLAKHVRQKNPTHAGPPLLGQLGSLFREMNAFSAAADDGTGTGATEICLEEQATYSKLATATPTRDVVAYAGDVCLHVACGFTRLLGADPGMKALVGLADRSLVGPFFASLGVSILGMI
ncbi:Cse1 domain containing protein [Lactarius tabidus]